MLIKHTLCLDGLDLNFTRQRLCKALFFLILGLRIFFQNVKVGGGKKIKVKNFTKILLKNFFLFNLKHIWIREKKITKIV